MQQGRTPAEKILLWPRNVSVFIRAHQHALQFLIPAPPVCSPSPSESQPRVPRTCHSSRPCSPTSWKSVNRCEPVSLILVRRSDLLPAVSVKECMRMAWCSERFLRDPPLSQPSFGLPLSMLLFPASASFPRILLSTEPSSAALRSAVTPHDTRRNAISD